jgi:hypothetical protein
MVGLTAQQKSPIMRNPKEAAYNLSGSREYDSLLLNRSDLPS